MKTKEREKTNKTTIRENAGKCVERLDMKIVGKKYNTQFNINGKKKNNLCMTCTN